MGDYRDNRRRQRFDRWSVERLRELDCIKLIEMASNLGPARARNEGLAQAKGKYVLLLDSDSYIGKTGIGKLVDRMESYLTLESLAAGY